MALRGAAPCVVAFSCCAALFSLLLQRLVMRGVVVCTSGGNQNETCADPAALHNYATAGAKLSELPHRPALLITDARSVGRHTGIRSREEVRWLLQGITMYCCRK